MKIEKILKQVKENNHSAFFYTPSIYKRSYSYLLINPSEILTASNTGEINKALKKISKKFNKGIPGYGLLDYEVGYAFEKKLLKFQIDKKPILSFFFFNEENLKIIKSSKIDFSFNEEASYKISSFKLNTSFETFCESVNKIRNYIAEGDTYQVNYTVKGKFNYSDDPENIFKMMVFNQSAKYTAFINMDNQIIISLSPELFFHLEGDRIKTKPMKGTTKRGLNTTQDHLQEYQLRNSNKDRAENLMIVDLLRNDLGRISEFGSVKVKELFRIEKYESILQMISVIQSKINKGFSFADIIKSLFPCGSITGAPKIRTMEIINELETETRGIYTGAIGLIKKKRCNPDSFRIQSEAVFNVAIRTIVLNKNTKEGEIGLGSGIVWDSDPVKEYEETLLKSNFFTKPIGYFELIETMKYENGKIFLFDEHIERLKNASDYFLFLFQEKKIKSTVEKVLTKLDINKKYRIRLKLNKWGKINFDINELKNKLSEIKIILSGKTIDSNNNFQYFKTTNRKLYDKEYGSFSRKGFFDVIFINEKNHIVEGAVSNIFLNKGGLLYTPPISSGALPGVYRRYFLQNNLNIKEEILYKDDLLIADEIFLTNSVREKVKVDKLYLNEKEYKQF